MAQQESENLVNEALKHLLDGRYRIAYNLVNKAYLQNPSDSLTLLCLAWAKLEYNQATQALEIADLVINTDPNNPDYRLFRGYFLLRMSIFEGALADIEQSIKLNSKYIDWAYLNKSRIFCYLERFSDSAEALSKAGISDFTNEDTIDLFRRLLEVCAIGEDYFRIHETKTIKKLFDLTVDAYKAKEYWFVLWISKLVQREGSLKKHFNNFRLLEIDSLYSIFQIKNAYQKIQDYLPEITHSSKFKPLYEKIERSYRSISLGTESATSIAVSEPRFDFIPFPDSPIKVVNAKTYDLLESVRSGKRIYLLQFDENNIKYIGIEVIIRNSDYRVKDDVISGTAVWYLNNLEVGRHDFTLSLKKDWEYVQFDQSWGTETGGFWNYGQGRVDIFIQDKKVCSRKFFIGNSEIVNFEESVTINLIKTAEVKQAKNIPSKEIKAPDELSLNELLNELDRYTGLDNVKKSMHDFVDYLKFIDQRKKLGLKTDTDISIHCIFLGNPGTGKTTIARLLGKIFKAMGILKNGHVIEVDRSGLVGQYIGETAQKTEKVINEAMGGLLFIDEAYTLRKAGVSQDFGQEAIDILLKRMEDNRGEFAVIAAGYTDEMKSFIESNPGLKSRFTHTFEFEDYTPEELIEIVKQVASKEDYHFDDSSENVLKKELIELYRKRDKSFGNARLVRNIFNEAKIQVGKRCLKIPESDRTKELLTTIIKEDIEAALPSSQIKLYKPGIDEERLKKLLGRLDKFTGLKTVKKEIHDLVKLAKFSLAQNEQIEDKVLSHFVFSGNPGTGKTTIARLFSEIYSALGLLPKGHLVEADRQGLVGRYVGETAQKTKDMIDKAIGGTLFIDEAYTLTKREASDFGQEAIDTLLKRMEDDRGKFIVIAAGYTEEMNQFLMSNPGLKSRFTKFIHFEDYSADELIDICKSNLKEKGYELDKAAVEPLLKKFRKLYDNRDKTFGNARLVRNLIESAIKNHILRISDETIVNKPESVSKTITFDDISDFLSLKKTSEVKNYTEEIVSETDKYLTQLDRLSGLSEVKSQVRKIIDNQRVVKIKREKGMKVLPKNLNMIFMGNPGTGKRSVALLLSKLLKETNTLEKGHVVEINRTTFSDLTEDRIKAEFDKLLQESAGGILYIKEASFLLKLLKDPQSFIEYLTRRSKELSYNYLLIIQDRKNEIEKLVKSFPEINLLCPNKFLFPDLTPKEMLEVALTISSNTGYQLDEGAWQLLLDMFISINKKPGKHSNAKTVKEILYKAISNQEERIIKLYNLSDEDLSTITFEDVDQIQPDEI
ncbi:MAG: AAA family ATPase [Ignavibacteriaceae bacterium]|nr:AAA family ATPase [Ignavibacteriaceae bacterium]